MEISVVMATYNCNEFLEEAIESVLSQTFKDFEFIIIDDGSTNDTVERVRKFEDSRIRLICAKHDYINSLNKGLDAACGKYIARMDSDDRMKPNRLALQYNIMENNPDISVCASSIHCFGLIDQDVCIFSGNVPNALVYMLKGNIIANPTAMIRRQFLIDHQLHYERYPYAEDYKFWSRIAECKGHFWIEPTCLLDYRVSSNQISQKYYKIQQETSFLIRNEILDYLINNAPKEIDNIKILSDLIFEFNNKEILPLETSFNVMFEIFMYIYNTQGH